ncbi:MAG: iron-containing alcohol dehydrogenase [Solobacterium sp.]|nr:iron-containing alcohol dehydrogenase [Solobacterium sp.]
MEFTTTPKIITGKGCLKELGKYVPDTLTRMLVVSGKSAVRNGSVDTIREVLKEKGIETVSYSDITGEPTLEMVENGLKVYKEEQCDGLIGIGGGSPMDAMKAIAMRSVYTEELSYWMGKPIDRELPFMVCIPTTAGTGSEVTKVTIITDTVNDVKMLLSGPSLLPDVAIADPELTYNLPMKATIASGLDALTHATEAYTSRKAQPVTDVLCLAAIKKIFVNLPKIVRGEGGEEERAEMLYAATIAGMGFANSSVTLIHGMSRPIGALFHVEHGISNAMLLKVGLGYARDGAVSRFADMAREIGAAGVQDDDETAADAYLKAVGDLCDLCGVTTLEEYGLDREQFFALIPKMAKDAVISGSPANTRRETNEEILEDLYRKLWD